MKQSWKDITVGDMLRIKEIGTLQLATEEEKNLKVAALLAEIDYDQIMKHTPLSQVRRYMDNASFLVNTKPQPIKARKKYEINGRTYNMLKNEMDLTVAQYIDFNAIQQEGFDRMPGELLAVMMVPEGHKYNDGYDRDQVIEDMYDLPIEEALGICNFFTRRFFNSLNLVMTLLILKTRWSLMWTRNKEQRKLYKETIVLLKNLRQKENYMSGWIV